MTVLSVLRRALLLLGLPAVLFAVWWYATADSTDFYVPPLSSILEAFGKVWTGSGCCPTSSRVCCASRPVTSSPWPPEWDSACWSVCDEPYETSWNRSSNSSGPSRRPYSCR